VIKDIEIETTRKDLTHLSGLYFFKDLISQLNLENRLGAILPQMKRRSASPAKTKFITGVLGFISGAECIDDFSNLRDDYFFSELTNGAITPSTMKNFLGSFRLKYYQRLQDFLPKIAGELRKKLYPYDDRITITMDATPHEQYGQYMEGVEWDYKDRWCYSSQNAFDEKGFCYGWNLMTGNSHSSKGAVEMIERIFKSISEDKDRFFRADSAYANHKVYNALITRNINLTICLPETTWGSILKNNWSKMKWTSTKIKFFNSKKCQISSTVYVPTKNKLSGKKNFLRVVFIRTRKTVITKSEKRDHRYYAIITNIPSSEMKDEAIINFYKKRANAENHIKDLKYGMDFKHFPCQSMSKNMAWGLMGIFAYNLMRFASFIVEPKKGCFLKRVRRKMVYLPSEIRKGQRKIKLRFSRNIFKEVKRLEETLHSKLCFVSFLTASG
jgi:hypothetical protein